MKSRYLLYLMRFFIILALILTLVPFGNKKQEIIVLLDVSTSNTWLHSQKNLKILKYYKKEIGKIVLSGEDKIAVLYFAEKPQLIHSLSSNKSILFPKYKYSQDFSNVTKAITLATKMFTQNLSSKKMIIFTDGLLDGEIPKNLPRNISLEWRYLHDAQIKNIKDLAITSIKIPRFAKTRQTISGTVTISTSHSTNATLSMKTKQETIFVKKIYLPKKGTYLIHFPWQISFSGKKKIFASVYSKDMKENYLNNNVFFTDVQTLRKTKILEFGNRLHLPNFEISHFSESVISTLEEYDIFVLSDTNSANIEYLFPSIKNHVEQGKSVFMIGGENSFSLGGYSGSLLEEILPVWCSPESQENTAIVVLLDISGSMNEKYQNTIKLEAAKNAIWQLIEQIPKSDIVKIVGFNSEIYNIFDTSSNVDLDKDFFQIKAEGKTKILPAIYHSLKIYPKISKKHIILISDGESPEEFTIKQLGALSPKTTLSVISTSSANNEILKQIALWGRGNFYDASSDKIKEFLIEDLLQIRGNLTGKNAILKADSNFFYNNSALYNGVPILQYIKTKKKKWGNNVLYTNTNDPILSIGNYVLGKTAAFTTKKSWAKKVATNSIIEHTLSWLAPSYDMPYDIITSHKGSNIILDVYVKKEPFDNLDLNIYIPWLKKKFPLIQKGYRWYQFQIFCNFSSREYSFRLENNQQFSKNIIITTYVPYSKEFQNLHDATYLKNIKAINKNFKKSKNMDNIWICIAIVFFLMERFLEKQNYGFQR